MTLIDDIKSPFSVFLFKTKQPPSPDINIAIAQTQVTLANLDLTSNLSGSWNQLQQLKEYMLQEFKERIEDKNILIEAYTKALTGAPTPKPRGLSPRAQAFRKKKKLAEYQSAFMEGFKSSLEATLQDRCLSILSERAANATKLSDFNQLSQETQAFLCALSVDTRQQLIENHTFI